MLLVRELIAIVQQVVQNNTTVYDGRIYDSLNARSPASKYLGLKAQELDTMKS